MKALLRGLQVMASVFGWQFTAAIVGVMALLVGAVWFQYGVLAAVIALLLCLLAIRAHDIGLDELERELLANGEAIERAREARAEARAVREDCSRRAVEAARLGASVMGGNHEGSEL